jgi:hypothetical protein
VPVSVETSFALRASSGLGARLEYAHFDGTGWRRTGSVALSSLTTGEEGAARGKVTFPLAGTWRVRQAVARGSEVERSAWRTIRVAAGRPKRRIRVVMFGDSMAGMPAISLRAMLKASAASMVVDYKSSSGVSRPDFFDWPARVRAQKGRVRPDVVVMMFGANDWQPIRENGRTLLRGSREWDAAYRRRLGGMLDVARRGDTVVYVVGQPISGRSAGYARHMHHINTLAYREALERPDVRYVSTWRLFATRSGAYSASLRTASGRLVRMRSGDDIHFTGAGARRMAAFLRARIEADWGRL